MIVSFELNHVLNSMINNFKILKLFCFIRLLKAGATTSTRNEDLSTPLLAAATVGHADVVAAILETIKNMQADHHQTWKQRSLISHLSHTSTIIGDIKAQELIATEINAPDNQLRTALFWASTYGFEGIVDQLTAAGATVNCPDQEGQTPLFAAASKG